MAEFNITQTKVSFSYETDQWSAFITKSKRKLVYDKDFLLFLREEQKNDQNYLSENLIGNWDCIKIDKLQQQGKIVKNEIKDANSNFKLSLSYKKDQWSPLNPNGRKVYDTNFLSSLREHPKSKERPEYMTEDFIGKKIIKEKTSNENEVVSKVLESDAVETNLHSSCSIDKNLVFEAEGINVNGSDFLLSLQHHSNCKQKPDNLLYEDIIGCNHDTSIDKSAKAKESDGDNNKLFQVVQSNTVLNLYDVGIQGVEQLQLPEDLMVFTDDNDIAKDERQCVEDRGDETNGSALDNNTLNEVTKFRVFYKKDQWSPLNPGGKKIYDKNILLYLREHPKSKEMPEYFSENFIANWISIKILKQNQIQRNRTDKHKNTIKVTGLNTVDKLFTWPEDLIDFKENDIAEEELVDDVSNSNHVDSGLCSSYMKDHWHHHPGTRIVYDKDFLLSLKEHPNSQKIPEHIIRNLNRIKKSIGDEDGRINSQSNPVETVLCSSPKKDVIEYDYFMTIQEWEKLNDKRDNADVKLILDCELTESKSVFSLFSERDQCSRSKKNPDALQENLIDLFDDNKLIENVNTVDESNPAEAKFRVTYKKDQWSPLNPFGRKVYDREFLLSLRWRVTD